jgi:N-acetylmuramic acid 6-phosphate etherase
LTVNVRPSIVRVAVKTTKRKAAAQRLFLGIDGGGTRTVALLADEMGRALRRIEVGPTNVKLLSGTQLIARLRAIARSFPRPSALGIGLAGIWLRSEAQQVENAAGVVWPGVPCRASNDLEIALAAAEMQRDKARTLTRTSGSRRHSSGANRHSSVPQVLILSGTGSCCFGKDASGRIVKMGGWGHLLGDKGSGYEIGLRALKAVVYYYDYDGVWPQLGRRLLRALQLNEPNDLIDWAHSAANTEIAALATEVFTAWESGDKIASDILAGAAAGLAKDAVRCADRLAQHPQPVQFVLAGGTLLKQTRFAHQVASRLRELRPNCCVKPLARESVWGAVEFANKLLESERDNSVKHTGVRTSGARGATRPTSVAELESEAPVVRSTRISPTEQRNPRSMNLHRLPIAKAIELMWSEDAKIPRSLLTVLKPMERTIRTVVRAFRNGGRLFYVGAGSSGRIGVLDASECPVTFSVSPEMVQGIMAGGQTALWQSLERAEDDAGAGARAVEFRSVTARDVVVGIAASGTTPFVWGALNEARRRRATAVLIAFNSFLKIPRASRPDICITPNLGPEILTGSTRLKAGTATKLILNTLTTLAMVRLGKVVSNLMVDVVPVNVKLRNRATRIVQELTGADYASAKATLEKSKWIIKTAVARLSSQSRLRRV